MLLDRFRWTNYLLNIYICMHFGLVGWLKALEDSNNIIGVTSLVFDCEVEVLQLRHKTKCRQPFWMATSRRLVWPKKKQRSFVCFIAICVGISLNLAGMIKHRRYNSLVKANINILFVGSTVHVFAEQVVCWTSVRHPHRPCVCD